ncbi:zinc ribbon domain-containing protein [Natranaeroarchaeum aerophilus]|uniref:Zinc ribbon domain-containing protein n=1 Tax=Natranaeroarchaeum aerophilus TaxID=2917711 RepID=A0AAE3K3X7_9EURY|nr:zinc ribbon domain-containing protein [Natranaeroarchaeum aerophilus]MCL9812982.1 zinc ribbon domain-containing protein [Natranaeroarchaeum aerophilus]
MSGKQKRADEVFCRSCGEPIKKRAEICPNCGVRNNKAGSSGQRRTSRTPSTPHNPAQYETTVSDTWWYGVAGGTALWALAFIFAGVVGDSLGPLAGFVLLGAWIGLPLAAYFDIQYVRANAEWNPTTVLWMILLAIWLVNILAGVVYLYRRHEVLGVP